MQRETVRPPAQKMRTWTLPTVLGLILGGLGLIGLVELRVQLNVTPQEQLVANEPFSAPFEIANTGYLSVHIENVTVIWPRVEYRPGLTIERGSSNNKEWDDFELERGESKTILSRLSNGRPQKASIVIAIDYRYFGIRGRRLFLFEGMYIEKWQWSKQPITKSEKEDFEKQVNYSLGQHRLANTLR